jgi:hypothetical protein
MLMHHEKEKWDFKKLKVDDEKEAIWGFGL